MRTQLSQFCQHFDGIFRPVLAPLAAAIDALEQAKHDVLSDLRADLRDLRHDAETLADKVRGQQAYVLIFGPLKSGKSTLMNAIAGSYVSEVSSLPAYPCLVFVSHGKKREYVVTDYRGDTGIYTDADAVHRRIQAAHASLAEKMREVEDTDEVFDPKEHYPAAIRRLDVRVPAQALQTSGAVLVDTPGLYTRMRFGYDRMTRDFRSAAACAVFVVKSDNLFLEQVFAEFNKLLAMFSRIFLVVNMDTTKRDLGPDGKLVPSLEQKSPEAIITAFENLAMTATLRHAAEEGRLRIYPVDLMSAASAALTKTGNKELPASFVRFRDDLSEYLASAEYLKAFLGDSLQRARALVDEAAQLAEGDTVARLRTDLQEVEDHRTACEGELARIAACLALDWQPAFERWETELAEEVERCSRDRGARIGRAMLAAIDTWFLSSHSLQWLVAHEWLPLARDHRESVYEAGLRCFERSCTQRNAGLGLSSETAESLRLLGIEVRAVRRTAQAAVGDPSWPSQSGLPLDPDAIPVRRGMLDLLAFRSADKVRRRLFGSRKNPDQKIESRAKMARLGDPGKHYLRERVTRFREDLFRADATATLQHLREGLRKATIDELQRALRDREPGLRKEVEQLAGEAARLRALLTPLATLATTTTAVLAKVRALSSQYAKIDPTLLQTPVEQSDSDGKVLEPRPKPAPARKRLNSRRSQRRSGGSRN